MTIAVCPGSYDPVTAGHLDVIERCAHFFDEVHVVVAVNAAKTPMFSEDTRVDMLADVETLFLPAAPDLEHISSSIVKDVARHGGDVTGMVPDCVIPLLGEALKNEKRA